MKSKRKVLLALMINKHYFMRGIVRYAREHNWYLVTDMVYTGRVPLGWRGDGILTILGYRRDLTNFIKSAGVPTVAITLVNDKIPLPRVEGDNRKIGQLAAEHFLERGYRHFAWAPFLNDVMDKEREEGFIGSLGKRGKDCHILPSSHVLTSNVWQENWAERRHRLIRELKELPHPSAIFAYNDTVAADIIDACGDAGLLVPEQIAVLGVDNDPDVCDCAPVTLSSVVHDLEGMAYQAAAMLDRLMKGGRAPRQILRVPPKGVVTRVSTDIHAVANLNVALALRHIAEHYHEKTLSVDEVVKATSISRRQLERVFRQQMGCSLNQHIAHTRLQKVKKLLEESVDPVTDISRQAGFSRPNHMFRIFRRLIGVSPKAYRASKAAKTQPAKVMPKLAR